MTRYIQQKNYGFDFQFETSFEKREVTFHGGTST